MAGLLVRHGRSDLLRDSDLAEALADDAPEEAIADAEELAEDLEALGPTYVKLGQLLSTRADLLPQPYLDALARLQDQVEPLAFEAVEQVIAEELGEPVGTVFAELDEEPIAAASLAQVHRGVLRSGREVAVKVQRPGIREQVSTDLEVLGQIAELLDRHTDTGQHYRFGDAIDEHELMRMAQKVANRVTAGLVLAALIVGASPLMQVDVEPRLFGYPALAIVLFLVAAAAGFWLLLAILFSDEHGRH